jgi:hypothetical protein
MGLLDSLADDDKLNIIRALTDSLRKKSDRPSLDSLFGVWKDDKSADEIIEEIYHSRTLNTRRIESFD